MATNSAHTIRVTIADDHAILRSGLKMLINAQPDMQVVGEASKVSEIAALLGGINTDVLLLDISMPGSTGFQALRQVQMRFPATRVVILTMHDDISMARFALAAGASGFVLKQAAHGELLSAIRAAHKGGLFVDPTIARALVPLALKTGKPVATKLLSDREQQVLQLLAQGYSNREIASHIYVSVKTVETYRSRITDKLGLRTRAEITRYALATGLLRPEDVLAERGAA